MAVAEIWSNASGLWFGRLAEPSLIVDGVLFTARSRGALIAEIRYRVPLTHLEIVDRMDPLDP